MEEEIKSEIEKLKQMIEKKQGKEEIWIYVKFLTHFSTNLYFFQASLE